MGNGKGRLFFLCWAPASHSEFVLDHLALWRCFHIHWSLLSWVILSSNPSPRHPNTSCEGIWTKNTFQEGIGMSRATYSLHLFFKSRLCLGNRFLSLCSTSEEAHANTTLHRIPCLVMKMRGIDRDHLH